MDADDDESDSMVALERRERARADVEAARARNTGKTASARVADAHASGGADAFVAYDRSLADRRAEPPAASTAATPSVGAAAPRVALAVDLTADTAAFTAQALARDAKKLVRTTQTLAERASYLIQSRFVSGAYMGATPTAIERQPQHESFLHAIGFETLDDERPRTLSSDDADRLYASLFVSSRAHEESMLRTPAPNEPVCAAPRCKVRGGGAAPNPCARFAALTRFQVGAEAPPRIPAHVSQI